MPTRVLRRVVIKRPPVRMMPVGVYRNHCTPGGIARHALLSYGWNRGQSGAGKQRSEAYREFETHGFSSLIDVICQPQRSAAA